MDISKNLNHAPDMKKFVEVKCKCGCSLFDNKTKVMKLPGILSPTGMDQINVFPVFVCSECKEILQLQ